MINIPGFGGTIIKKGDEFYDSKRQQYAYYNDDQVKREWVQDDIMDPNIIVFPRKESVSDIIAVVNYARENNLSIAVRTGGHQYSGASSTNSKNIQLDIEDTFQGFDYNRDTNRLRLGISQELGNVNANLRSRRIFVPHGECFHVHVGGHCQSGGYGQNARAHGLFGDHIIEAEIITADGTLKTAKKNSADPNERELFYAAFGGSPGNFGIVTHLIMEPLKDEDYPNSRALNYFGLYDRKTVDNLLTKMTQMADDDELPRDVDYTVTVIRASETELYRLDGLPLPILNFLTYFVRRITAILPPLLQVWVQWANVEGEKEEFEKSKSKDIFKEIDECYRGKGHLKFTFSDWKNSTPMSNLTLQWVFPIMREYPLPYIKRGSSTRANNLTASGWGLWASDRIAKIYNKPIRRLGRTGVDLAIQMQVYGGKHSAFINQANNGTSYSYRDARQFSVMDAFYRPGGLETATKWTDTNDKEQLKYFLEDRRAFWASFANDPDGKGIPIGHDLMRDWALYYESEEKFKNLVQLKKKYDPYDVFTPNLFSLRSRETF
eukprot:gene16445-22428_t